MVNKQREDILFIV